jgi:hypothetical protein
MNYTPYMQSSCRCLCWIAQGARPAGHLLSLELSSDVTCSILAVAQMAQLCGKYVILKQKKTPEMSLFQLSIENYAQQPHIVSL